MLSKLGRKRIKIEVTKRATVVTEPTYTEFKPGWYFKDGDNSHTVYVKGTDGVIMKALDVARGSV